jgi:hypothetical protein
MHHVVTLIMPLRLEYSICGCCFKACCTGYDIARINNDHYNGQDRTRLALNVIILCVEFSTGLVYSAPGPGASKDINQITLAHLHYYGIFRLGLVITLILVAQSRTSRLQGYLIPQCLECDLN